MTDETDRQCLAIEVARSFTAQDVIGVPQCLFAVRVTLPHLRSDNGPQFRWLPRADVRTLFIAKGSPWENGYVESAGGKLRGELLNRELFLSFEEACWVIDHWRLNYNPPPHPPCIGLPDPRRVCGCLCSSGFGYATASRTQPSYLTLILSLRMVQRQGVVS